MRRIYNLEQTIYSMGKESHAGNQMCALGELVALTG